MTERAVILDTLRENSCRLRDLCGSRVDIIHAPVNALEFLRGYVAANKPCIIKGATKAWAASRLWCTDYLRQKLRETQIPVAVTPNGRADAVTQPDAGEEVFALPLEGNMSISDLLSHLASPSDQEGQNVIYMQQQNDCLRLNFPELLEDVEPGLAWADTSFGGPPEAVNLWLGNNQSVTSFHKDHYENMFAVIRGSKKFTVLPPGDVYRLHLQHYQVAQYQPDPESAQSATLDLADCPLHLEKVHPESKVKWSPVDPDIRAEEKFALFFDDSLPDPITIDLQAGDVLYLPSLWHHFVKQNNDPGEICIAVNFWYDMAMGTNYSSFCLAEGLADSL